MTTSGGHQAAGSGAVHGAASDGLHKAPVARTFPPSLHTLRNGLASYAATLNQENRVVVPPSEEEELPSFVQQACEQLVGVLGVYNLWIALLDGQRVTAVASSFRHGFGPLKERLLDGFCPHCLNRVLQQEGAVVVEDPKSSCTDCPLSHSYHGRVGLAMRIEHASRVLGVLCASVPDVMANDAELHAQMTAAVRELGVEIALLRDREEWLRSEAMVHSVYRAAPVGIGLVVDGDIREVNDMLCAMTGTARDDLIGRPFARLFRDPAEAERVASWMSGAAASHPRASTETVWRAGDGHGLTVRLGVSPLDLERPECGVTFSALDISAHQEAERALAENRRLLESLMHSLPGMAYRCRLDADWTMEFVSRGCRELTGYPESRLTDGSVPYASLIHPDDRERVYREVSSTPGSGTFTLEYRIRRSDGEERWVWERGRVVADVPEALPMVEGFIIDITERRQMDEKVIEIKRNESLAVMAGGIAHDFNNILSVIIGNATLCLERGALAPAVRTSVGEIMNSAEKAAGLCRQLLSFCCGTHMAETPVQLNELVGETLPHLRGAMEAGADIEAELARDMPSVTGDPSELRQLVIQLVNNAVEAYHGKPGSVRVATGVDSFDGRPLPGLVLAEQHPVGRYAWIDVTDRGCGMDDQVKRKMFDPFFTTKFTGRGMGLAAVQGIVHAHKGFISVSSSPRRGTTVRVYLPASEAGEPPAVPATAEPLREVRTVLVVDDDATLRHLTGQLLDMEGVRALEAVDGLDAVRRYEQHADEIDLVLMDLTMPRLDGLEAAARIRAIHPGARIILTTGYSEDDIRHRMAPGSVDGILLKPYSHDDLARLVHPGKTP